MGRSSEVTDRVGSLYLPHTSPTKEKKKDLIKVRQDPIPGMIRVHIVLAITRSMKTRGSRQDLSTKLNMRLGLAVVMSDEETTQVSY